MHLFRRLSIAALVLLACGMLQGSVETSAQLAGPSVPNGCFRFHVDRPGLYPGNQLPGTKILASQYTGGAWKNYPAVTTNSAGEADVCGLDPNTRIIRYKVDAPENYVDITSLETSYDIRIEYVTVSPETPFRGMTMTSAPSYGVPGASLHVYGRGVTANEPVVFRWGSASTWIGGQEVGRTTADGTGMYTGYATIPGSGMGTGYLWAVGEHTGRAQMQQISVSSGFYFLPGSASPGDTVTWRATGAPAGATVNLHWGSASGPVVSTAVANSAGVAEGQYTVGDVSAGAYPYTVTSSSWSATANLTIGPKVTANPGAGSPRTTTTLTLRGFTAGSTASVYWDDQWFTSAIGSVVVSGNGTASVVVSIPNSLSGDHTLYVRSTSGDEAEALYRVQGGLTLSPSSGAPRSTVNFALRGYGSGEVIDLRFGSTTGPIVATATTGTNGAIAGSFSVPLVPGGANHVYAVSRSGGADTSAPFTVTPGMQFYASNGARGASITTALRGFGVGETVTLRWDSPSGATVGSATTSTDGSAQATMTIPLDATAGSHRVYAVGASGTTSALITVTTTGTLSFSPSTTPQNSTVSWTASGFAPNATVSLRWSSESGPIVASATADASGVARGSYQLGSAPNGTYPLVATGSDGTKATGSLTIKTATASLSLSPSTAAPYTRVTWTASGYPAGATVSLRWSSPSGTIVSSATATSNGTATGTYTPGNAPNGTYPLYATSGSTSSSASLTISNATSLAFSPSTTPPRSSVSWTATGFPAGSTVYLRWSSPTGTVVSSATASNSGVASGTYTLGAASNGTYPLYATGSNGKSASGSITIQSATATPALIFAPSSASPGGTVNWTATNMGAGCVVDLRWSTATGTVVATATANGDGNATGSYTLGKAPSGTYPYYAVCRANSKNVRGTLTITSGTTTLAKVSPTPTKSASPTPMTTPSTVASPSAVVSPTAAAPPTSTIEPTATATTQPTATATIEPTATVTPTPAATPVVTLISNSSTVGESQTATVTGVTPGAVIDVVWDDSAGTVLGNATAAADGSAAISFVIPNAPAGDHTVTIREGNAATVQSTLTVRPALVIDATSVMPGDQMTLALTGFGANDTVDVVVADQVIGTMDVDGTGSGSTTVTVPDVPFGEATVSARGQVSAFEASAPVTVTNRASVDPGSVEPGQAMTVAVQGYGANETVAITIDGVSVGTVITGATGAGSATVVVPTDLSAGEHTVVISGPSGASASLTVVVVIPPTPEPTAPPAGPSTPQV